MAIPATLFRGLVGLICFLIAFFVLDYSLLSAWALYLAVEVSTYVWAKGWTLLTIRSRKAETHKALAHRDRSKRCIKSGIVIHFVPTRGRSAAISQTGHNKVRLPVDSFRLGDSMIMDFNKLKANLDKQKG